MVQRAGGDSERITCAGFRANRISRRDRLIAAGLSYRDALRPDTIRKCAGCGWGDGPGIRGDIDRAVKRGHGVVVDVLRCEGDVESCARSLGSNVGEGEVIQSSSSKGHLRGLC